MASAVDHLLLGHRIEGGDDDHVSRSLTTPDYSEWGPPPTLHTKD